MADFPVMPIDYSPVGAVMRAVHAILGNMEMPRAIFTVVVVALWDIDMMGHDRGQTAESITASDKRGYQFHAALMMIV